MDYWVIALGITKPLPNLHTDLHTEPRIWLNDQARRRHRLWAPRIAA